MSVVLTDSECTCRNQNSPGGVVETGTGETDGRDWGTGDDVTVAVEGGERWSERKKIKVY